ncbi:MAG TPA: phosphoglucosamine mutase, partial [Bacteroidales bacterium]|nr:phosphoglucosamine mutase [Bacteroidales bacterium]
PTVEMKVVREEAHAGLILTASHNPGQWNALKLLNEKGEFISSADGERVLALAENERFVFAAVDDLGSCRQDYNAIKEHIESILALPLVRPDKIEAANFHIVIDCVNSTGGLALPPLLEALGVARVTELYCEPDGQFPHNPEPLPEHLTEISSLIKSKKADLGFVVDPDVDRLAVVTEEGKMFGEEYTLVAVADYILRNESGNTVSNLSSTAALRDITVAAGGSYYASAVGEVNVVKLMKEVNAVIGGEGNGGVIYPALHYGRDALVGIALFLSYMAEEKITCSNLRSRYPDYHISKNKIELKPGTDVDLILENIKTAYAGYEINSLDGVKIYFGQDWVHLRKSNTEPIIRIYAESTSRDKAEGLGKEIINKIQNLAGQ